MKKTDKQKLKKKQSFTSSIGNFGKFKFFNFLRFFGESNFDPNTFEKKLKKHRCASFASENGDSLMERELNFRKTLHFVQKNPVFFALKLRIR